jgi:hypothetical protein
MSEPVPVSPPVTSRRIRRIVLLLLFVLLAIVEIRGTTWGHIIPGLPFKDADDVMRMLQVLTLRDGGDWFDLTQQRLNPPAGVAMHWSRLPDLPLLGMLALTVPVLGQEGAILATAILVPVLLSLAYYACFLWAARPLAGPNGTLYAALIGFISSIPLYAFTGGRIDHHGWQLVLAMVMAGAALRIAAGETGAWLAVVTGIASALGLWVGAEALPPMVLVTAVLILTWLRHGAWAADRLALHGLTLALATLVLIPLALAPGQRAATHCDAFSLVSFALGGATALFGLAALAFERRRPNPTTTQRLGVAVMVGGGLLLLLYFLFPQCASGPYAGLPPEAAAFVAKVAEAQPLWRTILDEPDIGLYLIALPFVASLLALVAVLGSRGRRRTLWLSLLLLITGATLVALWQLRGAYLANAFASLALAWLAARVGVGADQNPALLPRLARRAGPALLVAVLPAAAGLLAASWMSQAANPRQDPMRPESGPVFAQPEPLPGASPPAHRRRHQPGGAHPLGYTPCRTGGALSPKCRRLAGQRGHLRG